jgi:hypothetical protein
VLQQLRDPGAIQHIGLAPRHLLDMGRAQLKVYKGFSHGMCTTNHDVINADLLAFLKS